LAGLIPPLWNPERHPRLILRTDEHPAYPKAIARTERLQQAMRAQSFVHETYSSRTPRTLSNPLFPVNYFDREMRKDLAAFRRESTCFTRNVANGLMRLSLYTVWHNYFKPRRIVFTTIQPETHAIAAGIDGTRIEQEKACLYTRRAFLSHQPLNNEAKRIWVKGHPTPLKEKRDYCPQYALVGYLQAS
jgi:hypothetical protein